jgi:hypothetical protein
VRIRNRSRLCAALAAAGTGLALLVAPASGEVSREPLSQALFGAQHAAPAHGSSAHPSRSAAVKAMNQHSTRRYAAAASEFEIASTHYDAAAVESVAAALRSLDHGPEMAELSVYVATAEEIQGICGATVIACYAPSLKRMVVSGEARSVAGVSRDFAIAHEYGHHIANSQLGGSIPAIESGTIRWATYERVCQLTRKKRLYPGDQGAHYWENPEEAFAQSYAQLNQPDAGFSWQYTPLLKPTSASLAKIRADVNRPWRGPVTVGWTGMIAGPTWAASRTIRTPLDGAVSVSLQAPASTILSITLREASSGRALARESTDESGAAVLSLSNCGRPALRLEVRSGGAAPFQATIERP